MLIVLPQFYKHTVRILLLVLFSSMLREPLLLLYIYIKVSIIRSEYFIGLFQIVLIIFAGIPPTTVLSGTSLETTAPAAITAFSPIVTPCKMVTFAPSHAFFLM